MVGPNGYTIKVVDNSTLRVYSSNGDTRIRLLYSPEHGEAIFGNPSPQEIVALREDLDYARGKLSWN